MYISGFTFVRNACKYDYPIIESISSLLPLVDELIVCLGKSEDETEALIQSIKSDKIKIINSQLNVHVFVLFIEFRNNSFLKYLNKNS
jgi:hypothetical protein